MASETITLEHICDGGNHLRFAMTGFKTHTVEVLLSELTEPLTDHDAEILCKVIARLAKSGRTNAQARTLLQAGVTVTV